ncbi:MAG: hypothetical protein RQ729_01160 [Wenzhouxiangellaceae bacterium]|nr:hypothetical protein [Wenzhouxiangellaceae bacterium]
MSTTVNVLLLLLFAAHLVAFARLGLKRRQVYYIALVVTFGLLTASFGLRLTAPDWHIGALAVHQALRYLAWCAAAVSISWTAIRLSRRRD